MREVGVRELKEKASDILRSVREDRETVAITYRGRVVARLAPAEEPDDDADVEFDRVWAEMDRVAEEIGKRWPRNVTAEEAVREQRRDA
ncbi:MAG: type II toxin-antitoxin system Phd/YefM family antitoxin [Chloroflexota bacterium]